MKKRYSWLWFDADGTLFDYERAERVALQQAFRAVRRGVSTTRCLDTYRRINRQVWQALERGEITPAELPVRRFELLRRPCDCRARRASSAKSISGTSPQRAELLDGAGEVLAALRPRYRFAIVTNGLRVVQRSRLQRSPIRDYISAIVISEEVGAAKPAAAFFDAARERTGHPAKSEILLIGDGLSSDIRGATDYGLDTCWFNPAGAQRPGELPITYEIAHLRELLELLR